MSKSLVIVESPAKAKTINKILGGEYVVKASFGHVRDLPERKLGISIKDGFKPEYVTVPRGAKIVRELRQTAEGCERIYLAPDADREGEAIAWHLQTLLQAKKDPPDRFQRVTYNEITPQAIREAFSHPRRLDPNMVDSQQARRVLDRLVGYQVSPLLWGHIKRGASAGRVQSVALRLVCEREDKIAAFVPEPYWVIGARVCKQAEPRAPFPVKLARINDQKADIRTPELAEQVRRELEGRALRVARLLRRDLAKRPYAPLITSTLQQAAALQLGFSPARTMGLAQRLYEGVDLGEGAAGLITYMRTDSVTVSADAQREAREFIRDHFGPDYLPDRPNVYKNRKSAQEAHEAIRPTRVARTPESLANLLQPDELKLYRLIWQRFLASQMTPARLVQNTAEIEALPPAGQTSTYVFRATATEVAFPGYMKASGLEKLAKPETEGEDESVAMPPLAEGEPLDLVEWLCDRKETQPPPRYNDASLVKALEEYGIGRPSTYAQILQTLEKRAYITREKKALLPTEHGRKVNAFLVGHLDELFNVQFTATMEESLDEIEEGKVAWTAMMADFYKKFQAALSKAKGPPADSAKIRALLDLFQSVTAWNPAVQRGKRTYDDQRFVASIAKQLEEGKKPFSKPQADALLRLALRYKAQIPDLERKVADLGLQLPAEAEAEPVSEATRRKLEALLAVLAAAPAAEGSPEASDLAFVRSLDQRAQSGRELTERQAHALDRVLAKYADRIPNFETLRAQLGLAAAEPREDAAVVQRLLDLLGHVATWRPPVKRGKWTWDDQKFLESLRRQFAQRGGLSFKQVALLRKMATAYREQIPDFPKAAAELGLALEPPKRKPRGKKAAAPAREEKDEGGRMKAEG
jgi:DNA topoisomerase-1